MTVIKIDGNSLTLDNVVEVARLGATVELTAESMKSIDISRQYVDELVESGDIVYGITTGFGNFSNVHISKDRSSCCE